MKKLSKMSLDFLEVESFVSPTEMELAGVKGGTTPAAVVSSAPCATDIAAGLASLTAIGIAIYNNYNSTPSTPTSTTTTTSTSTYTNSQGGDSTVVTTTTTYKK